MLNATATDLRPPHEDPIVNGPRREAMLLTFPIVRIFEDRTSIGEFTRGEYRVSVEGVFEGWWCEALGFGESRFNVAYTMNEPVSESEAERLDVSTIDIPAIVRDMEKVLIAEVASAKQFFYCETSGGFVTAMLPWLAGRTKFVREAIARFNAYQAAPIAPEGENDAD